MKPHAEFSGRDSATFGWACHAQSVRGAQKSNSILLIEDSLAVANLIMSRLAAVSSATIVHCTSLAEARRAFTAERFAFAITGLNLPDGGGEDILGVLDDADLTAIVFTARHDAQAQARYAQMQLLDYCVKDENNSIGRVVQTAVRVLGNADVKVLVVDDQNSARQSLVDLLTRHNFDVREARSGAEALTILAEEKDVELLITDYNMPDMDGYTLVQHVRQSSAYTQLRIIGVTSSSDRRVSSLFLKAGANDFIYRPLLAEEFQCRIDSNVDTIKLIKRLRYFAERDQLTNLPNRRYFFEVVAEMMREDQAMGVDSAVALLDIDFFKKVNDTYGHEAGDDTLRRVAGCVQEAVEGTPHMAARLGGEEFAFYLRGLTDQSAHDFCEAVRIAIEEMTIELRNGTEISVTTSFGLANVQAREPLDNQLNAADQFLYMAKANGRNQVFSEMSLMA
ncbi:diguanylate cyclase [Rhizobium sp. AG855]|uniref:GGDEF domain-containing response regulator n=1 Tax=Rhizobium sp. AG855 TaxID=2183898 RepID=UPI000E74A21C|nr:diguanylate cyclase [Rhizobium sp. AG855]RKE85068.1 response regulator receiver modulated diguanylate cyclase [Rhizobium sp. AG855]